MLYQRSLEDPQGFWAERAEELEWFKNGTRCWTTATRRSKNGLRRQNQYRAQRPRSPSEDLPQEQAGFDLGRRAGDTRTFSYFALNREVCKFANVLRSMGVQKGDIVTIYMPRIPEQVIAMLACAKIGAMHSVVYGGFSVEALAERIQDAQSRLLITADGGWLRGKIVGLKDIADEAIARQATIESVIVVKRTGQDIYMEAGRDYWYHDLMSLPIASVSATPSRWTPRIHSSSFTPPAQPGDPRASCTPMAATWSTPTPP